MWRWYLRLGFITVEDNELKNRHFFPNSDFPGDKGHGHKGQAIKAQWRQMTHEKYNLDRPAVGLFFRSIWARQIFDVVFTIMVCVYYKIHHISIAVTYLASIRLLLAERMLYDLPISPSPRYFRHIAPLFLHATLYRVQRKYCPHPYNTEFGLFWSFYAKGMKESHIAWV